jgi:hypothetical protein
MIEGHFKVADENTRQTHDYLIEFLDQFELNSRGVYSMY